MTHHLLVMHHIKQTLARSVQVDKYSLSFIAFLLAYFLVCLVTLVCMSFVLLTCPSIMVCFYFQLNDKIKLLKHNLGIGLNDRI